MSTGTKYVCCSSTQDGAAKAIWTALEGLGGDRIGLLISEGIEMIMFIAISRSNLPRQEYTVSRLDGRPINYCEIGTIGLVSLMPSCICWSILSVDSRMV